MVQQLTIANATRGLLSELIRIVIIQIKMAHLTDLLQTAIVVQVTELVDNAVITSIKTKCPMERKSPIHFVIADVKKIK